MTRVVHGIEVHGIDVGAMTECAHYHSGLDIVAIRFKCRGLYYPCFSCHEALAQEAAALHGDCLR